MRHESLLHAIRREQSDAWRVIFLGADRACKQTAQRPPIHLAALVAAGLAERAVSACPRQRHLRLYADSYERSTGKRIGNFCELSFSRCTPRHALRWSRQCNLRKRDDSICRTDVINIEVRASGERGARAGAREAASALLALSVSGVSFLTPCTSYRLATVAGLQPTPTDFFNLQILGLLSLAQCGAAFLVHADYSTISCTPRPTAFALC